MRVAPRSPTPRRAPQAAAVVPAALLAVGLAAACGGGGSGTGDGGRPDGGPLPDRREPDLPWLADGQPPVEAPRIPWLEEPAAAVAAPAIPWLDAEGPVALACPEGWREVPDPDAGHVCLPYEAGGARACGDGEAHFPGAPGCAPVGDPCPAEGDWPDVSDVPGGAPIVHVRFGELDGTGTRDAPFGVVAEAFEGVEAGTWVVLAAGTYVLPAIPAGVSIRGKCAAETAVQNGPPSQPAAVVVMGGQVHVENVRVAPRLAPGVLASGADTRLTLRGVVVDGALAIGLTADAAARVDAEGLVVRDTAPTLLMGSPLGFGISVQGGAVVTAARVALTGNAGVGATVVGEGSVLALEDARLADGRPAGDAFGWGLLAAERGEARVDRAVVEGHRETGVSAIGAETVVTLADVVVRDTAAGGATRVGAGLDAADGGLVTGARVLLDRNATRGALVRSVGRLELEDFVVRDTGAMGGDALPGDGIRLESDAAAPTLATLSRGVVARSTGRGLLAEGLSRISGTDLRIRGLAADVEGDGDYGALAAERGSLELIRSVVERARGFGVLGLDLFTSVRLEDVVVRDTRPSSTGRGGVGLRLRDGAEALLVRAAFERNHEAGVCVTDGPLIATDLTIRGTAWGTADGCFGTVEGGPPGAYGLAVARGGSAAVGPLLLEDNAHHGLYAQGDDVTLELGNVVIRGTRAPGDPALRPFGVRVSRGAALDLERALLEGNAHTGLGLGGDDAGVVEASLRDVVVRDTLVDTGDAVSGFGLEAARAVALTVERSVFRGNVAAGLNLVGPGLDVALSDVTVQDTAGTADGRGGYAVAMYGGGALTLAHATIERAHQVGLLVATGDDVTATTTLDASDLAIRDTRPLDQPDVPDALRGTFGWGLSAEDVIVATLSRVLVDGSREIGVGSSARRVDAPDAAAALTATDLLVRATGEPACGAGCAGRPPGTGLATYRAGRSRLAAFAIEGSAFCGVQIAADGEVDLARGRIEGHPVAVCLGDGGYDVARLRDEVDFRDNAALIEAAQVVVPDPPALLDPLPPADAAPPSDEMP